MYYEYFTPISRKPNIRAPERTGKIQPSSLRRYSRPEEEENQSFSQQQSKQRKKDSHIQQRIPRKIQWFYDARGRKVPMMSSFSRE